MFLTCSKLGVEKKEYKEKGQEGEKYSGKPFSTLGANQFSCCVINRGSWWYNFEWGLFISAGWKMDIREYNKGPCTVFSLELPVTSGVWEGCENPSQHHAC